MMDDLAAKINAHLEAGGVVQVTTYLRSTVYNAKHTGWFYERGGELFVRRGRSADCLSCAGRPAVGIRFGRYS